MSELTDRARKALEGITPGKWRAARASSSDPDIEVMMESAGLVIGVGCDFDDRGDREYRNEIWADADFIAAAPALVAELADALDKADREAGTAWSLYRSEQSGSARLRATIDHFAELADGWREGTDADQAAADAIDTILSGTEDAKLARVEQSRLPDRFKDPEDLARFVIENEWALDSEVNPSGRADWRETLQKVYEAWDGETPHDIVATIAAAIRIDRQGHDVEDER